MHRCYQPALPSSNLLLKKRWDRDSYHLHRSKVRAAQSVINDSRPRRHAHLKVKLKKIQLETERLSTNRHDDRLLQKKKDHIQKYGGYVDHIKHDYMAKSLNGDKMYRELVRVWHENLAMLKRIEMRQPNYSLKQWKIDFEENVRLMYNISRYPPHIWPRTPPSSRDAEDTSQPPNVMPAEDRCTNTDGKESGVLAAPDANNEEIKESAHEDSNTNSAAASTVLRHTFNTLCKPSKPTFSPAITNKALDNSVNDNQDSDETEAESLGVVDTGALSIGTGQDVSAVGISNTRKSKGSLRKIPNLRTNAAVDRIALGKEAKSLEDQF